ncbi:MAG: hypothetical protein IT559_00045 [Alphaproteobacteria bacterium]|nr:hypothetical protein [Alphaproteobacteria bacterium]
MFSLSGITNIIKERQTEAVDTRQAIQRHDPDFHRHRKDAEDQPDPEATDDGATVSTEALRIFLENFIRESGQGLERRARPRTQGETESTTDEVPVQAAPQGRAAQAAQMYRHAAEAREKSTILLETTDSATGPEMALSANDTRTIHRLIENLKTLSARGVELLHIERAETFLQSLINAVEAAEQA